ncbi:DNA-methyltransferase [[Eubacterium] cellulosolvens]
MRTPRSTYPERVLKGVKKEITSPKTWHKVIIGDSRQMAEVKDGSVHLMITSPPYPMIKMWDQFFQSVGCRSFTTMHEYLAETWREVYRVLIDGGVACINIGDATRTVKRIFRLFPNHAKVIEICESLGFVSLPNILWMKPTTKPNAFLGSGFLPPNAYVTLDCEYILIFRKGDVRSFKVKDPYRYSSHFTKKERDTWFSQIWDIPGVRQASKSIERKIAAFPEEIAYRLIRMFSVIGDVVLDPFLGTGTTTKVAKSLYRNSIGYEVDENLLPIIKEKIIAQGKQNLDSKLAIKFIKKEESKIIGKCARDHIND